MVSPSQIAQQLVDWTDPRRLVDLSKTIPDMEFGDEETSMKNLSIHVDLAIMIMTQMKKGSSKRPLTSICSTLSNTAFLEEERKILCSMLGKLYITAEADADKLRELYDHVSESVSGKVVADALSKAALNKLEQSLGKIVGSMEDE
jgi:condensin complex subunit 3